MNTFLSHHEVVILSKDLQSVGLAQLSNLETTKLSEEGLQFCKKQHEQFQPAQVGRASTKDRVEEIRRDQSLWIDEEMLKELPGVDQLYSSLIMMARETLFMSAKRYECHFSYYQEGDFYLKHTDRHKGTASRLLTVLLYLNDLPKEAGGTLVVDLDNGDSVKIQPQKGKLVIFDSQLKHEVLKCSAERWAISGWIRDDERPF